MHSRVFVCCKRVQQHDSMLSGTTPVLQLQRVKAAQVGVGPTEQPHPTYFLMLAHAGGRAGMWL